MIRKGFSFFLIIFVLFPSLEGKGELPQLIKSKDGMEMVLVGEGNFFMGSQEGEDEAPVHIRYLPAFYIDRYEVSNAQYARFVAETGHPPPPHWKGKTPPPGEEDLPVTNITWFDAMRYAIWAGKRLPTEAEWEKAARGSGPRIFPWGDRDDPGRRNLSSHVLKPVNAYPNGISPYYCFNMAGNVWEWTADWYTAYPQSRFKSPHLGRKYKVIRGGGALEFYSIPNTGRCAQRARLVPYGYYEGLGFRCVKDVDPKNAPYDPLALLEEAEEMLKRPLSSPSILSYEKEFQNYLAKGYIPLRIDGTPGEEDYVRVGVPFPKGLLDDVRRLKLLANGGIRPLQAKPLSFWEDGSVSWALLDFPAKGGETLRLQILPKGNTSSSQLTPIWKRGGRKVTIDTGKLKLRFSPANLLEIEGRYKQQLIKGIDISLKLGKERGEISLHRLPPERFEIEEGTLHSIVRLRGSFAKEDGVVFPFYYDLCIHSYFQSAQIHLSLTIFHLAPREGEPAILSSADWSFLLGNKVEGIIFGGDKEEIALPFKQSGKLIQESAFNYKVKMDGKLVREGIKAEGWGSVKLGKERLTLWARYFSQEYPIAIFATPSSVGLSLWAGEKPLEWEGGMAKTYDVYLLFSQGGVKPPSEPLVAILPPAWVAGTKVLGDLVPRSEETLMFFPYWEAMLEESMREWARGMATGMRDFGDAYYGGPYKGKNSYANLEYDVPLNFLIQFLRTGERWYFDIGEMQVRHQCDIDIDHYTGRQWKHSPLHTTTEADLGHIFLRGLLLYYLLSGEQRSLESAEEIGRWLKEKVERLEGIGNERQIGWSLYALCELYKVTGKETYLKPAEKVALCLAEGQSPTGRFDIRWDNRISFFNGIAMAGLLDVYSLTGREEIYQALFKLAQRTLGFYPEYACRTLDAFSYLAERTKDPRFWDIIQRTWETSMDYLLGKNAIPAGTFSWQFLHFAVKHRFPILMTDANEPLFPHPEGWHSLRLKGDKVELLLKGEGNVMAVLEGLNEGEVTLYDGKRIKSYELKGEGLFKRATIPFRGEGRILLSSTEEANWEVHYEGTIRLRIYDPDFANLPHIFPRAYCEVKEGAKEIRLRLKVKGEGFHRALIRDPRGKLVSAGEKFIDLGDNGVYEMEIQVPLREGMPREGWGIELYRCEVLEADGLSSFYSVFPLAFSNFSL